MSEGELIPPIQVEVQSHPIAHWLKSVRREEKTLASLGIRDEEATRVFRHYYLPGEEYIRETAEGQKSMVRALLDPEEYVVRIEGEEGFNNLLKAIQTAQQKIRRGAKKAEFPHFPIGTTMEMIVGEADNPSACCRFTLLDAQRREEKLMLTHSSVEHEKDWGSVLTAARFSQEKRPGTEAVEEEKPEGERKEGKPSVIISKSSLTEGQKQTVGYPRIAVGGRTGNKMLHQRWPKDMTQFIDEESSDLEIDPTRDHLWVVVLDARAYRQSQKEIKRRNLPANK